MSFAVTLSTVLVMLAYSIPGYALVKTGFIKERSISAFAAVLLYLCTPFQALYAMQQVSYSSYLLGHLALALGLSVTLVGGMLGITYLLLRRKQKEVAFRICTSAAAIGNCGFMGIPLLQALLPDYPQAVAFASAFILANNIMMWTVVSYIFTRDTRYISLKKMFLNPATLAMGLALVLFFCRIHIGGQLGGMIELLGKMSTPLCMLILGMRLACVPFAPIFTRPLQYLAVGLKLILFPLLALAVCALLPVEREFAQTIYILSAVPVGNYVLSFAEMLGDGQDVAANVVLLSTILSLVTVPVMLLIA